MASFIIWDGIFAIPVKLNHRNEKNMADISALFFSARNNVTSLI